YIFSRDLEEEELFGAEVFNSTEKLKEAIQIAQCDEFSQRIHILYEPYIPDEPVILSESVSTTGIKPSYTVGEMVDISIIAGTAPYKWTLRDPQGFSVEREGYDFQYKLDRAGQYQLVVEDSFSVETLDFSCVALSKEKVERP